MGGSTRFKLNVSDLGKTLIYGIVVGIAAGLTWLIENQGSVELGDFKLVVAGILATLLEMARRFLADNSRGEIVPFSALTHDEAAAAAKAARKASVVLLLALPFMLGSAWAARASMVFPVPGGP